ncbi:2'-5' RNA ligase family protein [Algoriphagus aquimarinus]|uniref:2'-5' RNA ligase family protein n=1 Tax=Algoriphagus aquimarinus TaxID=237018 RepID=A0A5C7B9G4_9BACT|nr:2'-5' RNA ligase family protein [Algoriphagus aquimarinus]TXE14472.1 2'-5' RNA ligase family protein [Algoriphagus aquimarinus]
MKVMQKYFLAIVPEGEFQERVTNLKNEIRDRYQAKYALKSPAHITLKMPFRYNEAKEEKLTELLTRFIGAYEPMSVTIRGVKTFGERVVYLGVDAGQDLYDFQRDLKTFCKTELNLVDELSDRNFHPHMTIAFKDLKKSQFQNIVHFSSEKNLTQKLVVAHVILLKKTEGVWELYKKFKLG